MMENKDMAIADALGLSAAELSKEIDDVRFAHFFNEDDPVGLADELARIARRRARRLSRRAMWRRIARMLGMNTAPVS